MKKIKGLLLPPMPYDSVIFHENWVQVDTEDQAKWFPVRDIIDVLEHYHLPPLSEGNDKS